MLGVRPRLSFMTGQLIVGIKLSSTTKFRFPELAVEVADGLAFVAILTNTAWIGI